jgi:hypothetical protein
MIVKTGPGNESRDGLKFTATPTKYEIRYEAKNIFIFSTFANLCMQTMINVKINVSGIKKVNS